MTTKHNRIIIAAHRCFRTLVLVSMLFASITTLQAQQQKQINVADFSILDMGSIEERVFVIHKLIDQGYYCYPNASHPDAVDVNVAADAADEQESTDAAQETTDATEPESAVQITRENVTVKSVAPEAAALPW